MRAIYNAMNPRETGALQMRSTITEAIENVRGQRPDRHRSESLRVLARLAERFNRHEGPRFNLEPITPPEPERDRRYLSWTRSERLAAAAHEVAHCIVGEALGAAVQSVQLGSRTGDKGTSGEAWLDGVAARSPADRLVIHAAGLAGEARLNGRTVRDLFATGHGSHDARKIRAILRGMGGPEPVNPADARAVQDAFARATELLARHAKAFNALTGLLARWGELDGDQVRTVMKAMARTTRTGGVRHVRDWDGGTL